MYLFKFLCLRRDLRHKGFLKVSYIILLCSINLLATRLEVFLAGFVVVILPCRCVDRPLLGRNVSSECRQKSCHFVLTSLGKSKALQPTLMCCGWMGSVSVCLACGVGQRRMEIYCRFNPVFCSRLTVALSALTQAQPVRTYSCPFPVSSAALPYWPAAPLLKASEGPHRIPGPLVKHVEDWGLQRDPFHILDFYQHRERTWTCTHSHTYCLLLSQETEKTRLNMF